jgi:hypothetical protein
MRENIVAICWTYSVGKRESSRIAERASEAFAIWALTE